MGGKFISEYKGKDLDETIQWAKNQKDLSTNTILESSADSPVNLNTLIYNEGIFTVYFYTNSYDDSRSSKPINIEISIDEEAGKVTQLYSINGYDVQRTLDVGSSTWTEWYPVSDFVVVNQNDEISVQKDTLVLRNIENIKDLKTE